MVSGRVLQLVLRETRQEAGVRQLACRTSALMETAEELGEPSKGFRSSQTPWSLEREAAVSRVRGQVPRSRQGLGT